MVIPLGPSGPNRVQIPQMPATGPVTLNNIKLDNSVVGTINTGNVRDIDVRLGELNAAGQDKLSNAIAALTRAVAGDAKAIREDKDTLLEQIAFLSSQATAARCSGSPD